MDINQLPRRVKVVEEGRMTEATIDKAYTRLDLLNKLRKEEFTAKQKEIIEWMFDNLLTPDRLTLKSPQLLDEFMKLISKVAERYGVSEEFESHVRRLSQKR